MAFNTRARRTYHTIIAARALFPKGRQRMQPNKNITCMRFSAQEMCLNLSEKSGTSATSNMHESNMKRKRNTALNLSDTRNACCPTTSEPQKRALAGVGSPINEVV
jgi:hypothetical protein